MKGEETGIPEKSKMRNKVCEATLGCWRTFQIKIKTSNVLFDRITQRIYQSLPWKDMNNVPVGLDPLR